VGNAIIKFLKIYSIFILFAILVNVSLEIIGAILLKIPMPENNPITAIAGIVTFYLIFSFLGALIFLFKNYKARKMGLLSLIIGFVLEFTFMRPEWVQNIYAFKIGGDVIVAIIATSFYWFIAWGIPSYIIHKYCLN